MNGGGALGIAHLTNVVALGSGAGSERYAATDLKLDRRVSVRVFDPVVDAAGRKRFGDASRVLGQVSAHPNVVTLYEAGFTTADQPFLILEMVESGSLADRLTDGPLPWNVAVGIVLQVCAGLGKAHEAGTLHRNIRPDSVMMAGGAAKLTDFMIDTDGPGPGPGENWDHAAPETFDGDGDVRSDLYSLASTLFELIDGHGPFWRPGEQSPDATMLRVRHQAPPEVDESVPEALGVFIKAALSKDVLDRPQSADEFAHELRVIRDRNTAGSNGSVLHTTAANPVVSTSGPVSGPAAGAVPVVGGATTQPPIDAAAFTASPSGADTAALAVPPSAPPVPVGFADGGPGAGLGSDPAGGPATSVYQNFSPPVAEGAGEASLWASPSAGVGVMDPAPPPPVGDPGWAPAPEPAADGFLPPVEPDLARDHDQPRRSPLFLVAIGLIAVGVLGLASVLAIAGLGGDDEPQAAPALPDPNAAVEVDAGGGATAEGGSAGSMVDGETGAMTEENATTSTTAAEAMEQTTTTVGRVVVPRVIGLDVAAASKVLSDAGLQVIVISRVAPNAQPGTVADQKPDPDSEALPGLSVTIYIPRVSQLPQMVGRPADAVCAELVALSLQCNRTEANSDTIAVGSVVSTNPGGGSQFSEGAVVEVLVSRGPVVDVAIPDVAGMTEEDARAALRTAGFGAITSAMEQSADREQGQAIRTDPAAATTVRSDQPITLYLSSGAPTRPTIPAIVGMTQAEAETALSGIGLVVAVTMSDLPEGDAGIGTVLSIDPAAGTQVDPGATVTITVGRQMAAENPPESTTTTVMADESTTTEAG